MCAVKIVELRKAEDEEFEAFQRLTFEEKFDFIATWMEDIAKSIAELARRISEQMEEQAEFEGELKGITKAVAIVKSNKGTIHNILKGTARSMYDRGFFSREDDKVREYLKQLKRGWYIV